MVCWDFQDFSQGCFPPETLSLVPLLSRIIWVLQQCEVTHSEVTSSILMLNQQKQQKQSCSLEKLETLEKLEKLEELEKLKNLQNLEKLEKLDNMEKDLSWKSARVLLLTRSCSDLCEHQVVDVTSVFEEED